VGFLDRLKGRRRGDRVDVDALAARASAAGIDGEAVKEVVESSRGPDGRIDWAVAAAKAQERGLDVRKLRSLMP
jgi:hypothetical protein